MVGDPCPPVTSCACRATRTSGFGAGHLFGITLLIKGASDGQPTQELQYRSACVFQGELWKVELQHFMTLFSQPRVLPELFIVGMQLKLHAQQFVDWPKIV